eukprot:759696-Hanusia_phi.AAC.4
MVQALSAKCGYNSNQDNYEVMRLSLSGACDVEQVVADKSKANVLCCGTRGSMGAKVLKDFQGCD